MSTKIDSSTAVGPAAAPAPVRPVTRSPGESRPAAAPAGQSGDSLALTGEARVLLQLEKRVQQDSGVDESKVSEMRRILAQGIYSADPQAIAGRLMQLEWSLSARK